MRVELRQIHTHNFCFLEAIMMIKKGLPCSELYSDGELGTHSKDFKAYCSNNNIANCCWVGTAVFKNRHYFSSINLFNSQRDRDILYVTFKEQTLVFSIGNMK